MNALPVAMATGAIHNGTITGKLNGVIPATTPSGSRNEYTSIPVETWSEYSPLSCSMIPQANSTTSSPRPISPFASERTLPCSEVTIAASSSVCAANCSRNLNRIPVRVDNDIWDHESAAFRAAATTLLMSSWLASRSSPVTCPVAGLKTCWVLSPIPEVNSPLMKCSIVPVMKLLDFC